MADSPLTLHVLSHTHWDREWYLTFEQFRLRLVDLIDRLLALLERDPDFRHFHLDAQTIVLEDYLRIRPQREALLKKLIAEKRIGVGPWYQLNDEFLTSAESTVRTLLVGSRMAKRFGHSLKLGYLPDQFGNISQMPQIFRGFGIDNCVFGRGWRLTGDRKMEFWWEGPDGSRVLTSFMAFWYNNAQVISDDPEAAYHFAHWVKNAMQPISVTGNYLLMNGVDHLEAQYNLTSVLKPLAKRLDDEGWRILHSTFEEYIESLRPYGDQLGTHKGELREDWNGQCLAGTLSSRVYLKQANDKCQILLERMAEPSNVWAALTGASYPHDTMLYAWKLLMENHPHDSICGCSIDAVHAENETRFRKVEEVGEELYARSLEHLAAQINTAAVETAAQHVRSASIVVFNPTSFDRTDTVEVTIDFPLGERTRETPEIDKSQDVTALEIVDANDDPVPFNLLDTRITYARYLSPTVLPMVAAVRRFRVRLLVKDLPGSGYATFKALASKGSQPKAENKCVTFDNVLENDFLQVHLHFSGDIHIETKPDCSYGIDAFRFESGGDVGDEYRYSAPLRDRIVKSDGSLKSISLEENGPAGATYRLEYEMCVPKSAAPDEMERSESLITLPITTWVTLKPGSDRVEFRSRVVNTAKDHRLRAVFGVPGSIHPQESQSEGHYDVVTRPSRPPKEWGPEASTFYPMQSWCDKSSYPYGSDETTDDKKKDQIRGLAVLNKGIREYEYLDSDVSKLAITLLRSVGRLSGGGDAPGAELVPGAQCQGTHTFEYALYPHQGNWEEGRVWQEAHAFATPLRAVQTDSHEGPLPPVGRFMEVSAPEFVVTAVKAAEPPLDGPESHPTDVIVRGYNISDRPLENVSVWLHNGHSCSLATLEEEPTDALDVTDGRVTLPPLGPKKIVTLRWTTLGN